MNNKRIISVLGSVSVMVFSLHSVAADRDAFPLSSTKDMQKLLVIPANGKTTLVSEKATITSSNSTNEDLRRTLDTRKISPSTTLKLVKLTPESAANQDEPAAGEYIKTGETIKGGFHSWKDSDSYFVTVSQDGKLEVEIEQSSKPLVIDVRSNGVNLASLSLSGVSYLESVRTLSLHVTPGEYEIRVRDLGSFSLNKINITKYGKLINYYFGIPTYTINTNFKAKPTQHALLVLLENGGLDIPADEAVATINMTELVTELGEQLGIPLNNLNDQIAQITDTAIEDAVVDVIHDIADPHYDNVIILEDGRLTNDNVIDTLKSLSTEYIVDIHVLTHGSRTAFIGAEYFSIPSTNPNSEFTELGFFERMGNIEDLYVRSVYQMNCWGGHLLNAWNEYAKPQAVSGTQDLNYMPPTYFVFLDEWVKGADFDDAVRSGYNALVPVAEFLYHLVDIRDEAANGGLGGPHFEIENLFNFTEEVLPDEELTESTPVIQGSNTSVDIDD